MEDKKIINFNVPNAQNDLNYNPPEIEMFDDEGPEQSFSNAGGYGFWCGKKCAAEKKAAGIPPLGFGKKLKADQAKNEAAAIAALNKPDSTVNAALAALKDTGTPSGAGATPKTKDNTMMYVAIGGITLVLVGFGTFMMMRKK